MIGWLGFGQAILADVLKSASIVEIGISGAGLVWSTLRAFPIFDAPSMNTFRPAARRIAGVRLASTAPNSRQTLVAAPDFISNLRPAIYDGVWFKAVTAPPDPTSPSSLPEPTLYQTEKDTVSHPYELQEFPSTVNHENDKFFQEKEAWNLQHRLLKQSLDAFNHAFWTDVS